MMTFCHKQMLVRRTEAPWEQVWSNFGYVMYELLIETGQAFSELGSLLQCAPEVGGGGVAARGERNS